jgi:histone arginine demethylase JMJD6
MFVPGMWWHAVINIDDTMAITQNYCNEANFDKVWNVTKKERKRHSVVFLANLKEKMPHLYERAIELNK